MSPQAGLILFAAAFLEVFRKSRWVALVAISSFSPPPFPDTIRRLMFASLGNDLWFGIFTRLNREDWLLFHWLLFQIWDLFHSMFSSTLSDVRFLYGHTVCGDITVWHQHSINETLWFYLKFCQPKESPLDSLIPLLLLLWDPQTWLEISYC